MTRYRYRTCVLVGPWRRSRRQAQKDAVAANQAQPAPDGELEWRVPGLIEERIGDSLPRSIDSPPLPRPATPCEPSSS
jgi:hypothetical protein